MITLSGLHLKIKRYVKVNNFVEKEDIFLVVQYVKAILHCISRNARKHTLAAIVVSKFDFIRTRKCSLRCFQSKRRMVNGDVDESRSGFYTDATSTLTATLSGRNALIDPSHISTTIKK